MKLAFTTLACPDWSLEQAVDAATRFGYDGIELRLLDGAVLQPDLDAATRRRVRAVCAAANLPIVCVDTSVAIAQPDSAAREAQIRDGLAFLELAVELHAPLIRVFGAPPAGTPDATAIEAAVAGLEPLARRGAQLGVAVALETHDAFCSSAMVAEVLNRSGAGAVALWDLLHPYRIGEPPADTLRRLGDRLAHVHIKDGCPPADGSTRWELKLLGDGAVPTKDILAALHAAGYRGWLAVEWEKKWHPHLAEPDVALPQHAAVLRDYLAPIR